MDYEKRRYEWLKGYFLSVTGNDWFLRPEKMKDIYDARVKEAECIKEQYDKHKDDAQADHLRIVVGELKAMEYLFPDYILGDQNAVSNDEVQS